MKPVARYYRNELIHDYIQLGDSQIAFCYEGDHQILRPFPSPTTIIQHFHHALDIYHTAIQLIAEEMEIIVQSPSHSDALLLQIEEYTRIQRDCILHVIIYLKTLILYMVSDDC